MNDINTVTISRGEYEILLREKAKLELVKKAVKKDDSTYGLSNETRVIFELLLGIEKAD